MKIMSCVAVMSGLILSVGCGNTERDKPKQASLAEEQRRKADQEQAAKEERSRAAREEAARKAKEDAIGIDVWAKYNENQQQAKAKYINKRTEVTGTIVTIRKGQEFPPSWGIFLRRPGTPGDYHYLITVNGDTGEEIIKHAKVGHEMTVQGSVNYWGSGGLLYIGGDKLIRVK